MISRFLSPGFIGTLVGIAVTLLAFADVWFWPAWPAYNVLHGVFRGRLEWTTLSYGIRAAVVVGLIAFNVAFWAGLAWGVWWFVSRAWGR